MDLIINIIFGLISVSALLFLGIKINERKKNNEKEYIDLSLDDIDNSIDISRIKRDSDKRIDDEYNKRKRDKRRDYMDRFRSTTNDSGNEKNKKRGNRPSC